MIELRIATCRSNTKSYIRAPQDEYVVLPNPTAFAGYQDSNLD
jgi:hypothetical protein